MRRLTARRARGMTLVEIMMVVGLSSLVLTGVIYIVQQGSGHFDSSVWYKENLTRAQVGLARLEEDLYKAANISEYVAGAGGIDEVKVTPAPFRYAKGTKIAPVRDPDTDVEKNAPVVPGFEGDPSSDPGRELFTFTINRLGSPGYTMRAKATLKGGDLIYEREWVGAPPTSPVPDTPLPPTAIIRNIDYACIEHENLKSELDPTEVVGSVVKFFFKIRDLKADRVRSEGRTLYITRSVKLSVGAAASAGGGGS